MVTQVLTIGLYCPQTGVAVHRQAWVHGGPFDAADDILNRLCVAACPEATDHYEVVSERTARNPDTGEAPWSQLQLFGMGADPDPAT